MASRLLGVDFIGDEMIINPHIKVNYGVTWSVHDYLIETAK